MKWKNGKRKLGDLVPWEHNPRQVTEKQAKHLQDSLSKFGLVYPPLISPDNEIYDGHQREKVMGLMDEYTAETVIDVRISGRSLTADERRELVIRLHENVGEWDFGELANLYDTDELEEWGFEDMDAVDWGQDDMEEDPGAEIDKADELREKWKVESGQLWHLGNHRVICGDCTDEAVVERLMGGERAGTVICDPPFAVRNDDWDTFENDKAFVDFTASWMSNCNVDVLIAFMADKNVPLLREAADNTDWEYRRALIWRKPAGSQFAGASLDGYWYDFEIIQVFGKPEFKPSKQTRMAVFEHRTITGQEHGAEKPVELLEDVLWGYSQQSEIMLDMFSGVGTGFIACERLNRKCYGIEIEPKYIAVTLERWSEMTGEQPELIDG